MVPFYLDNRTNSRGNTCAQGFLALSQALAKPPSDPTVVFRAPASYRESTLDLGGSGETCGVLRRGRSTPCTTWLTDESSTSASLVSWGETHRVGWADGSSSKYAMWRTVSKLCLGAMCWCMGEGWMQAASKQRKWLTLDGKRA